MKGQWYEKRRWVPTSLFLWLTRSDERFALFRHRFVRWALCREQQL